MSVSPLGPLSSGLFLTEHFKGQGKFLRVKFELSVSANVGHSLFDRRIRKNYPISLIDMSSVIPMGKFLEDSRQVDWNRTIYTSKEFFS